ncbi:response regulator [Novosphingobium sp. JCM 18896]|uniref:response regulator n=1 Tax=Novosphingobium sp. JCM 18896 TaxID=2989731 RepID=UPI0022236338|nr:response regulator [Novosphingobium sp. JCM 18896]MCW1432164.1 response regulator [Novosphingobium sp. JCM 18896]
MLNGQRILVLEEQPLISQLFVGMLDDMNCRVIGPASRVPEALALLVENDVDAAILDVKIEGQSTAPIAEELIRRAIPWAFASSNETEEIGRRYPDVPIIVKPFTSDHLQSVLNSLLAL